MTDRLQCYAVIVVCAAVIWACFQLGPESRSADVLALAGRLEPRVAAMCREYRSQHEGTWWCGPTCRAVANRINAELFGGRMSGGEQQMLTVARTLMGNPYLVLLDEPSEGVAPVIVEQMANMILELKAQGVSILLSEQNMHFAELVSDRAYVLEKGQIRYHATMAELAANDEVRRAYLSV